MKFKPSQVKRVSKTSPIGPSRMTQGKNPGSKAKHQTAAFRKWENRADNRHHGLPVAFTTGRGGGGKVVLPRTHGHEPPSALDLRFSFAAFRLPA